MATTSQIIQKVLEYKGLPKEKLLADVQAAFNDNSNDDIQAWIDLGDAIFESNSEASFFCFYKVATLEKENADAFYKLSMICSASGSYESARDYILKAIEISDNVIIYKKFLLGIYNKLGDEKNAKKQEQIIKVDQEKMGITKAGATVAKNANVTNPAWMNDVIKKQTSLFKNGGEDDLI